MTTATAVLLLGVAAAGAPVRNTDMSVSLAIPSRDGERRVSVESPSRHFHVVIHNIAESPQRIWDATLSWGYHALSFEIVGEDGSVSVIRKRETVFTRNVPATSTMEAGGAFVFDVHLEDRTVWGRGPPSRPQLQGRSVACGIRGIAGRGIEEARRVDWARLIDH